MFISFSQILIILSYSINGHSTLIHTCTIFENIRYSPIDVYIYIINKSNHCIKKILIVK